MLSLIEDLPVDLVGTNVLGNLSLRDLIMLDRAYGSEKSYQLFLDLIPYNTPIELPSSKHNNISALEWIVKRQCKIRSLTIQLPGDNPCLHVKNLQVEYFDVHIHSYTKIEKINNFLQNFTVYKDKVRNLSIEENQDHDVMEQLSVRTGNVKQLILRYSYNGMFWLNVDILLRWNLKEVRIIEPAIPTRVIILIAQTCSELTSIILSTRKIDDSAVIAIAQHCPKLETLQLLAKGITYTSLIALSERGLPLQELECSYFPNIPTADIARRCTHALSCIRSLNSLSLTYNGQDASILIPYMTGLTSVDLDCIDHFYIPVLTQHCHKLTEIKVQDPECSVTDIMSLCRVNPLLEVLSCPYSLGITSFKLKQLIHACPHLHTLKLPYETDITDTGILALSKHCPQLQELDICRCRKLTDTKVQLLLQRCRKLTRLEVSRSSLSDETWTQLDHNTKKGVSRWW